MKLIYDFCAKDETEATVLGNGRIGLWAYRRVEEETIHLNESGFWSGTNEYRGFDRTKDVLRARELLFKGKYRRAQAILSRKVRGEEEIQPIPYQPIGDLVIRSSQAKTDGELDMEKGVLRANGTVYFVSHVDKVFVVETDAETVDFCLKSPRKSDRIFTENGINFMTGNAPGNGEKQGTAFCTAVLPLRSERKLTLVGTIVTGYNGIRQVATNDINALKERAEKIVRDAEKLGAKELLSRHEKDFSGLFNRSFLHFGKEECDQINVAEELSYVKKNPPRPSLVTAYYEFAKYLTLSSSRNDSFATNLQGIWNKDVAPAWKSDYTVNINTEMNYWFPDCANLGECFEPFARLTDDIQDSAKKTAKNIGAEGECVFHNVDATGLTFPVTGNARYSFFPFAGVWLCTTLFDHYLYTLDEEYLERIYDRLHASCEFVLSYLVEHNGELISAPSTSPENVYRRKFGFQCALSLASTCDMFLARRLLDDFIKAEEKLNRDENLLRRVKACQEKLYMPKISADGRLAEYYEDMPESEKGHRHFSHLIGVFPLGVVTAENKAYFEAARKSLVYRLRHGSGYTGWSCAWALNLLAAFGEKELYDEYLARLFKNSTAKSLLDMHPPFQIDGNFGAARALCESVATVQNGEIVLFPVRGKHNESGSVKNLCLKGGYKITMEWADYRILSLSVDAEDKERAKAVTVRYADGKIIEPLRS